MRFDGNRAQIRLPPIEAISQKLGADSQQSERRSPQSGSQDVERRPDERKNPPQNESGRVAQSASRKSQVLRGSGDALRRATSFRAGPQWRSKSHLLTLSIGHFPSQRTGEINQGANPGIHRVTFQVLRLGNPVGHGSHFGVHRDHFEQGIHEHERPPRHPGGSSHGDALPAFASECLHGRRQGIVASHGSDSDDAVLDRHPPPHAACFVDHFFQFDRLPEQFGLHERHFRRPRQKSVL